MFRNIALSFSKSNIKLYIRKYVKDSGQPGQTTLCIKDMPHPTSLPLIGTKLALLTAGSGTKLHEYIDRRHNQLGPIFYERLDGSANIVFISDPTLMKTVFIKLEGKYPAHILPEPWVLYQKLYGSKRGLFFMDGEEWLKNRRIMNTHLLREGAEKWLDVPVKRTIENFISKWKLNAKNSNIIPDLESEFYRLSTDVIISVLLGRNFSLKASKEYEELLLTFSGAVKNIFVTTTKLYGFPLSWCQRFNLKLWRNFKESVDTSIFLAQKIVVEILNKRNENDGLVKKLSDECISDEIITRIAADFVIAAGDTTAYTTLWILYLLSKNQEYIDEIRSTNDRSFIKYVVKEAMRLYPVAPFLTRILPRESILGPYTLPEGTPIVASIYTSGRNDENFSRANEFLPYRWDRNDPRRKDLINHVHSASLPFAIGSRSCIGKRLAMVQLTEIIEQVVLNFDLKCRNSTDVNAVMSQILVPDKSIELELRLRRHLM